MESRQSRNRIGLLLEKMEEAITKLRKDKEDNSFELYSTRIELRTCKLKCSELESLVRLLKIRIQTLEHTVSSQNNG